jgi:hypothetical protein
MASSPAAATQQKRISLSSDRITPRSIGYVLPAGAAKLSPGRQRGGFGLNTQRFGKIIAAAFRDDQQRNFLAA